jgi:hypothetical protein
MMKPYSEIAAEMEQRKNPGYQPPAPATVRQTPVEIPGVMYQSRELYQPVVSQPKDSK